MNETMQVDSAPLDRALARAALYRFLAAAFLYPRPGTLRRLRKNLPRPEALELMGASAMAPTLHDVERLLGAATEASIEAGYVASFGHTTPESYPPIETRYGSSHPFQESQDLGDVAAFYEAFGLRVRPGTGERVDHVALELEFMYLLALKEAYAREGGDAPKAEICLAAGRHFFGDHLGRWGPVFAGLLARHAPSPVTCAFGALLAETLEADRALLGVVPRAVAPQPVQIPPEPDLDGVDPPTAVAVPYGPSHLCG